MSDTPRTDEFICRAVRTDHNWRTFARQLERELAASQAGQAELLDRLQERTESHLASSARYVQTIQRQAVELAKWQALAEGLAGALKDCKNRAMDKSIETHADDHAKGCVDDIWEWAESALAAYEAAKAGQPAKKPTARLDEPPGPA